MKMDFTRTLKRLDGQPLPYNEGADATLKLIVVDALSAPERGPDGNPVPMAGSDAMERFCLSQRVFLSADEIDVSSEEISLIKKLVAQNVVLPLYCGQALFMLDG